ncbi:MAG: VapC toxin family PIN domain ribonuclease [Chloroflexota bacterium]|nr:VapC toxin family PIN domain ribonuclease [Chloroflexota bacterium]
MVTTDASAIFVDTNVLTRATIASASLHREAQKALDALTESGVELWISAQIIREYMVNTTREQSYSQPIPMPQVLEQIKRFRVAFKVAEETTAVLDKMLELAAVSPLHGKQIHDVNIVATMINLQHPAFVDPQ